MSRPIVVPLEGERKEAEGADLRHDVFLLFGVGDVSARDHILLAHLLHGHDLSTVVVLLPNHPNLSYGEKTPNGSK